MHHVVTVKCIIKRRRFRSYIFSETSSFKWKKIYEITERCMLDVLLEARINVFNIASYIQMKKEKLNYISWIEFLTFAIKILYSWRKTERKISMEKPKRKLRRSLGVTNIPLENTSPTIKCWA